MFPTPKRRTSCPYVPSPQSSIMRPVGKDRSIADTLRYLEGDAEPVPRNSSSPVSRPAFARAWHTGASLGMADVEPVPPVSSLVALDEVVAVATAATAVSTPSAFLSQSDSSEEFSAAAMFLHFSER